MVEKKRNEALEAEGEYKTAVEEAYDYVENFDILETITNVGNDEVFTPRKTADMMLDSLPEEVWKNPNYKWLNPATKNGIFEREIAIRLDEGLKDSLPNEEERRKHILQNMIYAIGQTKFTSNVARRTVYYCSQANRKCDGLKAPDGHFVNGYSIGNGTWFNDEEGNIKTPNSEHEIDHKTKKCKHCGISDDSKYLDKNQLETYAYEFIHVNHLVLQKHLQNRYFKGDKTMRFDIIIGNPPYQLEDGGSGASARPIYQLFVNQAISLNPKFVSMIIPARWYAGGKGLDEFREKMLADRHIKKLVDFVNAKECFPSSSIGGGVCYFLWDNNYSGNCDYENHHDGKVSEASRKLNQYPVFVRYNEAISIINKITKQSSNFVSEDVISRNPFGLPSSFRGSIKASTNCPIKVITSEGEFFAKNSDVTQGRENINDYKVMISKLTSEHAGEPSKDGKFSVVSTARILKPNEVCTDSYLILFTSKSELEVGNYFKYLTTKFYRFLLLQSVSSINLSKDKFNFVPKIDFSKPITDKELFSLFGIDENEIDYIDSLIREK